ncbi:hypothetical protein G3N55_03960 [Dissulfurirhabdus thermomarina]|uniref:histidine kinase n=1 Tax=Dissulfurirhabdus thermomarina TaxID=1765737 RepID=A0A6N9TL98_DISTH|nr:ATP-binding protein [Dissulfurirhabdus thermomarina]NDY42005.1 hypothetical protein [Dissulfurirhabdus thermomarina]NMX24010.1 hypothetical protein [Dissulfurirhabdus thermomarina]
MAEQDLEPAGGTRYPARLLLELAAQMNRAFLRARDLEGILRAVLVGVTAGEGLGFNRAFLLRVLPAEGILAGEMAVGPASREEAGRIWHEVQRRQLSLFDLIDHSGETPVAPPLGETARAIRVPLAERGHLLVRALLENREVLAGPGAEPAPEPLARLLGTGRFAAAPLSSAEAPYGLILVDNRYTGRPITPEDMEALRFFAGLASLAVDKARTCEVLGAQLRELARMNEEIERNKDLLVQAERYAALGRMADQLLHELRNPVAAMGGLARRLHREAADGTRLHADAILQECRRVETILDRLMDFAEPPPGLRPERVPLHGLVHEVLVLLRSEMERRGICCLTRLDPGEPAPDLDPEQFRRCLLNVLKNALEAMPGGGTLTVGTRIVGDRVEIRVSDTGPGLARGHLSQAMEPFFTLKPGGMGLGLAVAKQIMERHGGSLRLACEGPPGVTAVLTLPLARTTPEGPPGPPGPPRRAPAAGRLA